MGSRIKILSYGNLPHSPFRPAIQFLICLQVPIFRHAPFPPAQMGMGRRKIRISRRVGWWMWAGSFGSAPATPCSCASWPRWTRACGMGAVSVTYCARQQAAWVTQFIIHVSPILGESSSGDLAYVRHQFPPFWYVLATLWRVFSAICYNISLPSRKKSPGAIFVKIELFIRAIS